MANFAVVINVSFIIMLAIHLFSETELTETPNEMILMNCSRYTFRCNRMHAPVCASDGRSYGNLCMFCRAYRKSNQTITYSHRGRC